MQYLKLNASQREELWSSLRGMPAYLNDMFSNLTSEQTRSPGPDGSFSPVEQIWHLADLEREGFGVRILKLLSESRPHLPDFDGNRIARDRNYRELSMEQGMLEFARARDENLMRLYSVDSESWSLRGFQEGVGEVSLCDIPGFMSQHDNEHKIEIETWIQHITG